MKSIWENTPTISKVAFVVSIAALIISTLRVTLG